MIFNINSYTGNPDWSDKPPIFTYSGNCNFIHDTGRNWELELLTSGNLVFNELNNAIDGIDIFLVGGGGGGGTNTGGGGGYTTTGNYNTLEANLTYPIIIGNGGASANEGGMTIAFGIVVNGGKPGHGTFDGGNGGSGGAASQYNISAEAKRGGSNGGNGPSTDSGAGGTGQGFTTRAFGELTYPMYAGGGGAQNTYADGRKPGSGGEGGGGAAKNPGTPNTGGGGGCAAAGGSGIVIIRNKRMANNV